MSVVMTSDVSYSSVVLTGAGASVGGGEGIRTKYNTMTGRTMKEKKEQVAQRLDRSNCSSRKKNNIDHDDDVHVANRRTLCNGTNNPRDSNSSSDSNKFTEQPNNNNTNTTNTDGDELLKALCVDMTCLLFTDEEMANKLSPAQLDTVQQILEGQLLCVRKAQRVQQQRSNGLLVKSNNPE